jgi:hypothetical protein
MCLFRFDTPQGYVLHESPSSPWKQILIAVGPAFVNTTVGFALGLLLARVEHASEYIQIAWGPLAWLAISVTMHAFPSTGDAKVIWCAVRSPSAPLLARFVGTPIVGLIFLGAWGSVVWLNLIYAYLVTMVLPEKLGLA